MLKYKMLTIEEKYTLDDKIHTFKMQFLNGQCCLSTSILRINLSINNALPWACILLFLKTKCDRFCLN